MFKHFRVQITTTFDFKKNFLFHILDIKFIDLVQNCNNKIDCEHWRINIAFSSQWVQSIIALHYVLKIKSL